MQDGLLNNDFSGGVVIGGRAFYNGEGIANIYF